MNIYRLFTSKIKAIFNKFNDPYDFIKLGIWGIVIIFEIAKQENIKPIKNSETPFLIAIDGKSGATNEYPIADRKFIKERKNIFNFIFNILSYFRGINHDRN